MNEPAHETRFEDGVLRCSCGWYSRKLLWTIAAVDEEAAAHKAFWLGPERNRTAEAAIRRKGRQRALGIRTSGPRGGSPQ